MTTRYKTKAFVFKKNERNESDGFFSVFTDGFGRLDIFAKAIRKNASKLWGLIRSPWGKAFTALRDNPIRAESLGIDIKAYTLFSFAIGAVYAGIAGGLFASLVQFIDPAPFTVESSIMMYLMVVVGGPGYFLGPLLGAAVGVILPEWLRFAQAWYLFVFGASVVLLMIWLPDGLLSIPDRLRAKRQSKEASALRASSGLSSMAEVKDGGRA